MTRIYLDYAATTPTHPEVAKAMLPYFTEVFGNPSTLYECGQEAKNAVEKARSSVAKLIHARDEEIIFTSGGTEADNFAVKGIAFANEHKGSHIITSAIEHHAVTESCKFLESRGFKVTYLPVDRYGMVSTADVRKAITGKTILISIMLANNEIGTIQPISEIGRIARENKIYLHTDAVQATGHIPLDVDELGVDLLSLSAHKFYGPKGTGALYVRKGTRIVSFMHGGGQESGRRASTENVAGIAGLGKAAEMAQLEMHEEAKRITILRDRLIKDILDRIDHTSLNGHPDKRLSNNANISFAFIEGEALLLHLDREGICVTTGSACSSTSNEASPILLAMGVAPECARGSIRFTLGKWTTGEDIDHVLEVLPPIVAKLRAISPLLKHNS
ncbi:cysteine desulfurase NifS [Chloroflexota bacterium]